MKVHNPILSDIIESPNIERLLKVNKPKDPSLFPRAKYIYICKGFESNTVHKINGIPRISRAYGIGILTERNMYYFSELHTRHNELTANNRLTFAKVFTSGYIYDKNTKIYISDNISKKEPIYNFIKIVCGTIGLQIRKTNLTRMIRFINYKNEYFKSRSRKYSLTHWHQKRMVEKLVKLNKFEFITDPEWYANLKFRVKYMRKVYIECAVAIFYMFRSEIFYGYEKKSRERKLRRDLENIDNDD